MNNGRVTWLLTFALYALAWLFYSYFIAAASAEQYTSALSLTPIPILLCAFGSLVAVSAVKSPRPLPRSGAWSTLYRGILLILITAVAVVVIWLSPLLFA
jgi:hypothetical protein